MRASKSRRPRSCTSRSWSAARRIPRVTICATSYRATRCASSGPTPTTSGPWRGRPAGRDRLRGGLLRGAPARRAHPHEPVAVRARSRGRPAGRAQERHVRPRRRGRRPDGPRGCRVRRLGGPAHAARRARGDRRPGRHVDAHRELPRLPERRLGRRPRRARGRAGEAARRRDRRHAQHRGHCTGPRLAFRDARRRSLPARARRDPGDGRLVPRAGGRGPGRVRGHRRLLRRRAHRGRGDAGPRGDPRRRRQLGGTGGGVLRRLRQQGDDPDPRREPGRVDVALPDRRARAQAERPRPHGR